MAVATRNWLPHVKKVAEHLERKYDVVANTYANHGGEPEGEKVGIDIWVAPFNYDPGKGSPSWNLADRILTEVHEKWDEWGVRWAIYYDSIEYAPNVWKPYDWTKYGLGSPNVNVQRHTDHVHLQLSYTPKGGGDVDEPLWGVDVASYQQGINFQRVANEGYAFAIVKATEGPYRDGSTYTNPEYAHQMQGARKAGMVTGAYHYLVETPAKAQVEHFLRVAGDLTERIVVVDFESYAAPYSYLTPTNDTLRDFIANLRHVFGPEKPIGVYSSRTFWNSGESSGALASYGANLWAWDAEYLHMNPGYGYDLYHEALAAGLGWGKKWGGVEPKIWQFSAAGSVAGMNIDVNAFRGTQDQLEALAGIEPEKPEPPKPETVYEVKLSRRFAHKPTAQRVKREIEEGVRLPKNMNVRLVEREKKQQAREVQMAAFQERGPEMRTPFEKVLQEPQESPQNATSHGPNIQAPQDKKPPLPKREPVRIVESVGAVIAGLIYLAFGAEASGQVPVEAINDVALWLSIIAPVVVGEISRSVVDSPATVERKVQERK